VTLSADLQERIHALWDQLADFEAGECNAALSHLLGVLAEMVSAQNGYWLGAVRMSHDESDPLLGWRPRIVEYLRPRESDESFARRSIRNISRGGFDESTVEHARRAGRFRAYTIRDIVSPEWFESDFYKNGIEPRGVVDQLFVIFPINDTAEGYYGFHRIAPAGLFSRKDVDIAAYAIRGLKWFHRQVMLSYGLLAAQSPIAPMERRILQLLLTDMSEKEISEKVGLTSATTHTYVSEIFRKFGVSGRAGLTALWLGRPPSK